MSRLHSQGPVADKLVFDNYNFRFRDRRDCSTSSASAGSPPVRRLRVSPVFCAALAFRCRSPVRATFGVGVVDDNRLLS